MVYRAAPVTQRDGSKLQFSNCRMAAGATGIDYDTLGATTTTGQVMRQRSGDPGGGTTSDDIARAWRSFEQTITVRDGKSWADAELDLAAGRLVHLDIWAEATNGPCLSGTGRYGHTIAIAPERDGNRWLVSDPWCSPPKWKWWDRALLQKGAEAWAQRVYGQATNGNPAPVSVTSDEWTRVKRKFIVAAARTILTKYRPDRPKFDADPEPEVGETSGPRPIMYTASDAHTGGDMAIQAPDSLGSVYVLPVKKGTSWYRYGDLTGKYGEFSSDRELPYVGLTVGEDSRAVIVKTSKPYTDNVDKPTVVYVKKSAGTPKNVGAPPPDNAARDKQWRSWLSSDSNAPDKTGTGGSEMTEEQQVPLDEEVPTTAVEDDDGTEDGDDTTEETDDAATIERPVRAPRDEV